MKNTYSEKLKSPKWQKKRLEILSRDNFTCRTCGDKETMLNVHHLSYSQNPWDTENDDLITLCEDCHLLIESIKKSYEFNVAKFTVSKFKTETGNIIIIHHDIVINDGICVYIKLKDGTIEYNGYHQEVAKFIANSLLKYCTA